MECKICIVCCDLFDEVNKMIWLSLIVWVINLDVKFNFKVFVDRIRCYFVMNVIVDIIVFVWDLNRY